jgi:two-component system cell cycle response regulator DivK
VKPAGAVVLLVEEYDDTRELMRMLLEVRGCRVVEAVNGQEAVELAPAVSPHLILMDLELPVLNGYEAARRILAAGRTKDVPIVAISANCASEHRQQALAAGCVECYQKPIDFAVIDDLVGRYGPKG